MLQKLFNNLDKNAYFNYLFGLYLSFALQRFLIYVVASSYILNYSATAVDLFKGLIYDFAWCWLVITCAELIEQGLKLIKLNIGNTAKFIFSLLAISLLYFLDQYYLSTGILLNNMVLLFTFDQLIDLLAFQDNISVVKTLWFIVMLSLFLVLTFKVIVRISRLNVLQYAATSFALVSLFFLIKTNHKQPNVYAINKTDYFLSSLINFNKERATDTKITINDFNHLDPTFLCKDKLEPYTLLDKNWNQNSEFATLFRPTSNGKAPNICIIIVESMSANLVGEYAKKTGHLMPFLDSLSKQSLFYPNALSTAQRTHHVLPAILGSLPHSRNHTTFQEVDYPEFESIFSLLKPNYYSSFYCGIDMAFDQMHRFVDYCKADYVSASFPGFSAAEVEEIKNYWGAPDGLMFREFAREAKLRKSQGHYQQKSALDVLLTISTHEPFSYPEKEIHTQFVERKLQNLPAGKEKSYLLSKKAELGTFHYTDTKLQKLFAELKQREEFENTIFIITGDHGSSLLYDNEMSKYRVPLLVYSPLLKQAQENKNVISHLDIAPTLLNYLRIAYGVKLPEKNVFLGEEFSISTQKPRVLACKDEYIVTSVLYNRGKALLAGKAYRLSPSLEPIATKDKNLLQQLTTQLDQITKFNFYAVEQNHIESTAKDQKTVLEHTSTVDNNQKNMEFIPIFEYKKEDLAPTQKNKKNIIIDVYLDLDPKQPIEFEKSAIWLKIGDNNGAVVYQRMLWIKQVKYGKKTLNRAEIHLYLPQEDVEKIKGENKLYCFLHNIEKQKMPINSIHWKIK